MAARPACVFVLAQPVLGVGQQAKNGSKNGSDTSTNEHPKIAGRPRAGLIEVLIFFHDVIIAENPGPAPQLTSTSKMLGWLLFVAYGATSRVWFGVGGLESLQPWRRSAGGANRAQSCRFKRCIDPEVSLLAIAPRSMGIIEGIDSQLTPQGSSIN